MNRRDADTLKITAKGFDPIYLHAEYEGQRPVKVRISSPGKYADQSLGTLLDSIADGVTRLLRSAT